ncbi:MAG TPA: hypothetical protein VKE74_31110 [Gemmataceae bacterium]|nr:hypothetical protein [Gemmataceae bacterium]
MAQLSLGESRWRMVRRVLGKKKFRFEDARNMTRHDRAHFDWLVDNGFFSEVEIGFYAVTGKGKESAELGLYEYEPRSQTAPAVAASSADTSKGRRAKK